MSDLVLLQEGEQGVTLVLNRPQRRNALSHALLIALEAVLNSQTCTNSTAVTITGAGSSFSAGADYAELTGTIEDLRVDEDIARVTAAIRDLGAPVTALVNGPCMGGAVDIALSCAERIALPEAVFQVPATQLSLLYNPVAMKRLVERYGKELVTRVMVDGERFDAASALQAGIVSRVVGQTPEVGGQTATDNDQLGPVAIATREMIEAIDRGDFDLEQWERIRRDFLGSDERYRAVAAFKSRMQS